MPATSPGGAEIFGERGPLGVVVIHEIMGRDDYVRSVASALANAGYVAAAVDLYDGRYAQTIEEGMQLKRALTDEKIASKLEDALRALAGRVGPGRPIGTLGFCMGGGYALWGACHRPFAFAVDFYGKIDRADDVAGLTGPVLVLLGSEDERITPWAFAELLPAAMRAKKHVAVELYPGVRHAFHRPGWEGHHAGAADAAWRRTLAFLDDVRDGREASLK